MNKLDKIVVQLTVQFDDESESERSSGILFLPTQDASIIYVITAKHSIYGEKGDKKFTYITLGWNIDSIEYPLGNEVKMLPHPNLDIAILELPYTPIQARVGDLPLIRLSKLDSSTQKCSFKGFPAITKNKSVVARTIENLDIVQKDIQDAVFFINTKQKLGDDNDSTYNTIKGFSGSGVWADSDIKTDLYLLGIVTDIENWNNRFECVSIKAIEALINGNWHFSTPRYDQYLTLLRQAGNDLRHVKIHFGMEEDSHIDRMETQHLAEWIQKPLSPPQQNIALLTGNGGYGKTTVFHDLQVRLEAKQIPVLALKADLRTSERLLTLAETVFQQPQVSFKAVVDYLCQHSPIVVVLIDQLDALSQTLSARRDFLQAYVDLINQLSNRSQIRILISVRKFDLEYDVTLKGYKKNSYDLEIQPLEGTFVRAFLEKRNIYKPTPALIELLRVPNHLDIFCRLDAPHKANIDSLTSIRALYGLLWEQHIASEHGALVAAMAQMMYEKEQLIVPKARFQQQYPSALAALQSKTIVVEREKQLQFFHQTFYEYAFARQFVESGQSLLDALEHKKQSLYMRSMVKLVLAYLREYDDEKDFVKIIQTLILSKKYRFHIKLLVINNLGMIDNPNKLEKQFVKTHILNHDLYNRLFMDSVMSAGWLRFLKESGVINDYLTVPKPALLEKKRNRIRDLWCRMVDWTVSGLRFLKGRGVINHRPTVPESILLEKKRNRISYLLRRNAQAHLEEVLDILDELPEGENKSFLVVNLLPSIRHWENMRLLPYFETYFFNAGSPEQRIGNIWLDGIIEKISKYHPDKAFDYVEEMLFFIFDPYFGKNNRRSGNEKDCLEALYKTNPQKTFDFLLNFMQKMLERDKVPYEEGTMSYLSSSIHFPAMLERETRSETDVDFIIFNMLKEHIQNQAKTNNDFFIHFFETHQKSDFIPVLRLILFGLVESPNYSRLFETFIKIIHAKKGFEGSDDTFSLQLRTAIAFHLPLLEKDAQKPIVEILLKMRSKDDVYKYEREGKKRVYLKDFGKKTYMYIKDLPESVHNNHPLLKKRYQELERKFGIVTEKLLSPSSGIRWTGNKQRFSADEYEKFTFKSWKKTMLRFHDAHKQQYARDLSTGAHADALKKIVIKNVDKFAPFVEAIIEEGEVSTMYMAYGLEGLAEKQFDPQQIRIWYKKLIQYPLLQNTFHSLCSIAKYLTEKKVADESIAQYFADIALHYKETAVNLSSIRSMAVSQLFDFCYDIKFKNIVLDTLEKVVWDEQTGVRMHLLNSLPYVAHWDQSRAFKLFHQTVAHSNEEPVFQHSIWTAGHFRFNHFREMDIYFKKLLLMPTTHEYRQVGELIFCCWVEKYEGAKALLEAYINKGDEAIVNFLNGAESHLWQNNALEPNSLSLFERFLARDTKTIAHVYAGLILRQFKKVEQFRIVYPFLQKYAASKLCSLDCSYFMKYLILCSKDYPKECLDLVSKIRFEHTPDMRNAGYYDKEPLEVILAVYSVLTQLENPNPLAVENALDTFDKMLENEHLGLRANEVLSNLPAHAALTLLD